MARNSIFDKLTRKGSQTNPPVPKNPEDKFRSPFTDQREEAPDNWARPAKKQEPNEPARPGTIRMEAQSSYNWQAQGYHMEQTPSDLVEPLDASNDPGYVTPKETDWYEDPFRDNAVDPGLRVQRSEAVEDANSPFYNGAVHAGLGQNTTGSMMPVKGKRGFGSRTGSRIWLRVSLIVAVLIIIGAVFYTTALRVTTIDVEGNVRVPTEQIIALSGIRKNANVLTILRNDSAIREAIERNPYLVFNSVKTLSPQHVVISVREREEAAYINYCGIYYVIDNRGFLLREVYNADDRPNLMRLEGLEVKNAIAGNRITVTDESKLDLYVTIMIELKAMKKLQQVTELYLTDMDNLYLATSDGYSVRLGRSDDLHAKLRAMFLTVDKLKEMQYAQGTIDVSVPESPTYIPENTIVTGV